MQQELHNSGCVCWRQHAGSELMGVRGCTVINNIYSGDSPCLLCTQPPLALQESQVPPKGQKRCRQKEREIHIRGKDSLFIIFGQSHSSSSADHTNYWSVHCETFIVNLVHCTCQILHLVSICHMKCTHGKYSTD